MRKFVTNVLHDHHVSDIETNMMVLAVDEVCANIIIHGHPTDDSNFVTINIDFTKEGIWFEIVDKGAAFDIMKYNEPILEDLIKNKQKGGVGIMLVKKIMDKIEFTAASDKNTLKLYKQVTFES
jgi:serine/threonine-protein kinase RsbW